CAGPVRNVRFVLGNNLAQDVIEQFAHALFNVLALRRGDGFLERLAVVPGFPTRFDFVVATPQHDAGMIAQALYLLDRLDAHVVAERLAGRRDGAAEHEVLPHHQPQLVGHRVEVIRQVIAAAPDAQHVHVGVARRLEQLPESRGRDARGENVGRDEVGTLGENRNAVDDEFETLALWILLAAQLDAAQTRFAIRARQYLAVDRDVDVEVIQVRFAVAARPPTPRMRDLGRNRNGVGASLQFDILLQRLRAAVGRAPAQDNLRRRRRIGVDVQ